MNATAGRHRGAKASKAAGDSFPAFSNADLEYDPSELPRLLRRLLDGHGDLTCMAHELRPHVGDTVLDRRRGTIAGMATRVL